MTQYAKAGFGGTSISSSPGPGPGPGPEPGFPTELVYEEDFELGNAFTLVGSTAVPANEFVRGTAKVSTGTHALYVTDDGGTTNSYDGESGDGRVHAYVDVNVGSATNFGVEFDWACVGEAGFDKGVISLASPSTAITPDGVFAGAVLFDAMENNANFVTEQITAIDAYEGLNEAGIIRIVFTFEWDGSITGGAPLAIDNFKVYKDS